jgi:hypothetical protein
MIQHSCQPESVNPNHGLKVLIVRHEGVRYVQWGMARSESLT